MWHLTVDALGSQSWSNRCTGPPTGGSSSSIYPGGLVHGLLWNCRGIEDCVRIGEIAFKFCDAVQLWGIRNDRNISREFPLFWMDFGLDWRCCRELDRDCRSGMAGLSAVEFCDWPAPALTVVPALFSAIVMNPGVILNCDTILTQPVNETAHGPALVLYTPAVTFTNCIAIAKGWRIA